MPQSIHAPKQVSPLHKRTEYWKHTPIQYKPSLRYIPIYGIIEILLIALIARWSINHLPYWFNLLSSAFISTLFLVYCYYLYTTIDILVADSAHAVPNEWTVAPDHVHINKTTDHVPSLMMNRSMSHSDAWWYFKNITLNYQFNLFCRVGRIVHALASDYYRFGTFKYSNPTQNYWFLMNSSLHRWLAHDGDIHLTNVTLPIVDPAKSTTRWEKLTDLCRGNSVHTFKEIIFRMDHDLHQVTSMEMDDVTLTDPYECMSIVCLVQGLYSHPQVHMAASEVGSCTEWSLAHSASNACNGLNRAAVMTIGQVITRHHDEYITIPGKNYKNGTPHLKGGRAHDILIKNSATYRMMLRAHKDPLIRAYAKNDPIQLVGLIHSSILHGVDHLLPDLFAPVILRSNHFGSNFTGTILIGASVNYDFTSNFSRVQDELTERLRLIVAEESPILLQGWQWAVAE